MCGDCWNAAMGAPAAVVAARFAWVGYKDRIPFLGGRRSEPEVAPDEPEVLTSGPAPREQAPREQAPRDQAVGELVDSP